MFLRQLSLPLVFMDFGKVDVLLRVKVNINHMIDALVEILRVSSSFIKVIKCIIWLQLIFKEKALTKSQPSVIRAHCKVL